MQNKKIVNYAPALRVSMFAALTAVCAWISVPTPIPFTLQTFAIFLAVGLLGTKGALTSLAIYVLLGLAGIPVFAGFKAGFGAIVGPTGGYLLGFFFAVLISGLIISRLGTKPTVMLIGHIFGLICLYSFGTAWFVLGYQSGHQMGVWAALSTCVFPYIVPDLFKILLAVFLTGRLAPIVHKPL